METIEKLVTVSFFAILLFFIIGFIVGEISAAVNIGSISPTIFYYMCALGIFDAINIFVSLLIASWFTNKLLEYLSG